MYVQTGVLKLKGKDGGVVPVYSLEGEQEGEIRLPHIFLTPKREDLVRRAVVHLLTHTLQPKGAMKGSGHKYSVESWGPGYGIARIARIRGRGTPKYGSGGMVPSAVGGRPTHPPVPEKKIHKGLNKKERRLALAVALAFTASREHVAGRGHRIPEDKPLPIVVSDELEALKKTREVEALLERLGLADELRRCAARKVRAGKGKRRGRRYKQRVGPLIVVANDRGVGEAAGNIPGVDVVEARNLSVLHLAPGAKPGRLAIFTPTALQIIGERLA
ncbi:MAG: 50S ribosomal protein L4 [Aigarchaeota archaeon]|nr:50S ribosomal protein L4 [Candidatus Pelearchaeum maunauluense]